MRNYDTANYSYSKNIRQFITQLLYTLKWALCTKIGRKLVHCSVFKKDNVYMYNWIY